MSVTFIEKLVEHTRELLREAEAEWAEARANTQVAGELSSGIGALRGVLRDFETALAYARGEEVIR